MKTIHTHFFAGCNNIEEVKALYKTLAKIHHPDKGGDLKTMQDINNEYTFACATITQGGTMSAEEKENTILSAEAYRMAIEKIINLDGIIIEIIGSWIWVSGATKQHSEYLKNPEGGKFWWASEKQMWYFRTEEYKTRNRFKISIDEIRNKYGSERVYGKQFHAIKN